MKSLKWKPQSEVAECGLACLSICLDTLGAKVDLSTLRRLYPVSQRGMTLKELAGVASALDLSTRAIRCDVDTLAKLEGALILHWNFNHFVVYKGLASKNRHRIIDPAMGDRLVDAEEMSKCFTGVVLEVHAAPDIKKRVESGPKLNLMSIIRWRQIAIGGLTQIFVLSLFLQAYVLASPLYIQSIVDESSVGEDANMLLILTLGFACFAVFNATAEWMRGVVVQKLSTSVGWDITLRLFRHMLRLPLPWFHRRQLADVLARFDSVTPIRQLIAGGFVAAVIDGALGIAICIAMFIYSAKLAVIVIVSVLLASLLKIATTPFLTMLSMRALHYTIAEQGKRIETLRAMQTIKLLSGELDRERDWANKFHDAIHANQKTANFQALVKSGNTLIDSLSLIIVGYFGITSVMDSKMSIGMLYAILAYRTQFFARTMSLVEQITAWRLLSMHTERLSEIVFEQREQGLERPLSPDNCLTGAVELIDVAFRYSQFDRYLLRGISLRIEPGQFIVITGQSGSGKSTLLKLLTALYPPVEGEIRFDGALSGHHSIKEIRQSIGAVMQDDELLSGSIVENVAFFDEFPDMDRVWECLRNAAIEDDVRQMPMQLNTLIGDMGSSLSGGQRQRLLLARALYKRPKILILDEATSNLDVAREQVVHRTLAEHSITRIVVTHRPSTMVLADRLLVLRDGQLHEVENINEILMPASDEQLHTVAA